MSDFPETRLVQPRKTQNCQEVQALRNERLSSAGLSVLPPGTPDASAYGSLVLRFTAAYAAPDIRSAVWTAWNSGPTIGYELSVFRKFAKRENLSLDVSSDRSIPGCRGVDLK